MSSNPYGTSFPDVKYGPSSTTDAGAKGAGSKARARYPHKPKQVDFAMTGGEQGKMKTRANDVVGGRGLKGY